MPRLLTPGARRLQFEQGVAAAGCCRRGGGGFPAGSPCVSQGMSLASAWRRQRAPPCLFLNLAGGNSLSTGRPVGAGVRRGGGRGVRRGTAFVSRGPSGQAGAAFARAVGRRTKRARRVVAQPAALRHRRPPPPLSRPSRVGAAAMAAGPAAPSRLRRCRGRSRSSFRPVRWSLEHSTS